MVRMKKRQSNFSEFVSNHPVLSLAIIILATIFITRAIIYYVVDPNPIIMGLQLHHFDYGLTILIITSLLLLFRRNHMKTYLLMLGISLGLIIDELWFIRAQVSGNEPLIYNPSLPGVLSIALIVIIVALLICQFNKK